MVKKTPLYLLISALAIFIFSLSQIQALTCPPGTTYYTLNVPPLICLEQSSSYIDPLDYIDPSSPDDNWVASDNSDPAKSNLCGDEGFYFVDAQGPPPPPPPQKVLTLKINVPKTFNAYKLNLRYRRGPDTQLKEDFEVKCGTNTYTFNDPLPPDPNDNIWVLTSDTIEINCDLTQGNNDITITATNTPPGTSVHFEQFSLEACIPDNYCTIDPDCNDNIDCTQDSCVSNTCNNLPNCPPGQYCSQTLGCTPILENANGPTAILPFFSLLNLLISALIIIFIYFLIKQKRNNKYKAKTSKRKLKY